MCLWRAQQGNRPLVDLSALLLYSEQSEHGDPIVYSRTISLWKWVVFNSIQVTNYWFTLHRVLRSLYQQAQTFSLNIQGISDQDVTLWTLLWYKNDNQRRSQLWQVKSTFKAFSKWSMYLRYRHSMCSQMRGKLWAFLIKLELYIEFNQAKFRFEMNKGLFTVSYLKNAAFDWVDPKLHEFLDKTPKKWMNNKKSIFDNYKKFKNELQRAFRVVDKNKQRKDNFTF
jgi:hypothetical protein